MILPPVGLQNISGIQRNGTRGQIKRKSQTKKKGVKNRGHAVIGKTRGRHRFPLLTWKPFYRMKVVKLQIKLLSTN